MTNSVAARAAEAKREAGRMGILLDAKLLLLYRVLAARADAPVARVVGLAALSLPDWPSEATAPLARSVGLAPLSLPLRVVGYLTETEFPSQPHLLAVELAESGEV